MFAFLNVSVTVKWSEHREVTVRIFFLAYVTDNCRVCCSTVCCADSLGGALVLLVLSL